MEGETMSKTGLEAGGPNNKTPPPPGSDGAEGYRQAPQQQQQQQHRHDRTASTDSSSTNLSSHQQRQQQPPPPYAKMSYHPQSQSYPSSYQQQRPPPGGHPQYGGSSREGYSSSYEGGPAPPPQGHHYHYGGHGGAGRSGGYHHSYPPPPPRSTQPAVRSVVTRDSFGMEEDQREDGSTRYSSTSGGRGGGYGGQFHPRSPHQHHYHHHPQQDPYLHGKGYGGDPPRGGGGSGGGDEYGHPHPHHHSHHSSGGGGGNPFEPPPPPPLFPGRELPSVPEEGESRMPPHDVMRGGGGGGDGSGGGGEIGPPPLTVRIPPSPLRGGEEMMIHRTHSHASTGMSVHTTSSTSGGPLPPPSSPHGQLPLPPLEHASVGGVGNGGGPSSGPLKRNFWHHSRPGGGDDGVGGGFEGTILPQEFMPPKRSKISSSGSGRRRKEYYVTARSGCSADGSPSAFAPPHHHYGGGEMLPPTTAPSPLGDNRGWVPSNRSMSWDARDDYYRRGDPRIGPSPSWPSRSPSREGPSSSPTASPYWSEGPPYMSSPRSRYPMMEVVGGGGGGGPGGLATPYDHGAMNMSRQNSWMSASSHSSITGTWGGGHHRQPSNHGADMPPSSGGGGHYPWGQGPQNRDERETASHHRERQEREGYDGSSVVDQYHHHVMHHGRGGHQRPYEASPNSYGPDGEPPMSYIRGPPLPMQSHHGSGPKSSDLSSRMIGKDGGVRLLALPEDRVSLSETLCLVRENIEVFTATLEDVEAPAPGRKHAVTVGQVGLRCIHCRHTTRSSERVKRAVCYPSSIKRIYRTVIDMKLDHFLHCKFVPETLKDTLTALKANNTRSTGTTMQYFIRAATSMGMEDGPSGVRIIDGLSSSAALVSPPPKTMNQSTHDNMHGGIPSAETDDNCHAPPPIKRTGSLASEGTLGSYITDDPGSVPAELFLGQTSLGLPEDKMSLSPLRCFLRQQVCAFSATEEDIAVRTPTTFAVTVGQVGIGCIHCLNQPAKLRLNRAVCFPFSIGRIYQSVADIQRFHLNECKLVPQDVKDKFEELQSQSSKGSKGLATRQYWITSPKKIGLVDTPNGIRFSRDPSVPDQKAVSLDILAQVASHVTTVNRPLVMPEDKECIAEFLYVVMEQLQPCRFTEADRNKRRLKDVGCIGVECKHCAGQVDGRKFFWSSVNAVESNFVSVHTHMMECRMIPDELKERLGVLKQLRKEQTAALKTGSQKAFFARVWKRLHTDNEAKDGEPDKKVSASEGEARKSESMDDADAGVNREIMKSPIQMTPVGSPESAEKPVAEINISASSPKSPDSAERIRAVSDKMAIVSV